MGLIPRRLRLQLKTAFKYNRSTCLFASMGGSRSGMGCGSFFNPNLRELSLLVGNPSWARCLKKLMNQLFWSLFRLAIKPWQSWPKWCASLGKVSSTILLALSQLLMTSGTMVCRQTSLSNNSRSWTTVSTAANRTSQFSSLPYKNMECELGNVSFILDSTVCIRDLNKLNLIWRFDFRLKPIFPIAPPAPRKIFLTLKVVKSDPKLITSLILPKLSINP